MSPPVTDGLGEGVTTACLRVGVRGWQQRMSGTRCCQGLAYLAYNLMSTRQVAESMSCPVGGREGRERKEEKIRLVQMGSASSPRWNRAARLGNSARQT